MSENRAWPPLHPQIDVRAASTMKSLANNSEQLFSRPNGLFEIEVAESGLLGWVGTEDDCLKGDNQLQKHISAYHDHLEPYDQDKNKENYRASFLLVVPAVQNS